MFLAILLLTFSVVLFRKFLEKDLIENYTLNALETSLRLNWWANSYICRKLWPLATTGDGNCLLHAASLAMWGFHDRRLTLRAALHNVLFMGECRDAIWRRWRFQQTKYNKTAGFVYSDYEWAKEWDEIVTMASPEPRQNTSSMPSGGSRRRSFAMEQNKDSMDDNAYTYESLEEIHVLALAHVLRRTIIVVSDTVLRDIAGEAISPITFGGIYMPFEIPANECYRSPLLLIYDMAHFSALVAMDSAGDFPPSLVPLVDCENVILPIQFCIDPGEKFDWRTFNGDSSWTLNEREQVALLKEYMDVVNAPNPSSPDDEIYQDYWTDEENDTKKQFADTEIVLSDNETDSSPKSDQMPNSVVRSNSSNSGPENPPSINNGQKGSKTAKQLQSVAKQFGSIGKNMSKKIKKNFGNIIYKHGSNNGGGPGNMYTVNPGGGKKSNQANISSSISQFPTGGNINRFNKILCAQLKSRRHEYQEEMIRNYLECAHDRFKLESNEAGGGQMSHFKEHPPVPSVGCEKSKTEDDAISQPQTVALTNIPTSLNDCIVNCINGGCLNYGTSKTSYMCVECYEKQKQQESQVKFMETSPRYGTGNSKFYTQTDLDSHNRIQRLPSVRRLHEMDQTLYLSNSTFYNDKLAYPGPPRPNPPNRPLSEWEPIPDDEFLQPVKVIQHNIIVESDHPKPTSSAIRPDSSHGPGNECTDFHPRLSVNADARSSVPAPKCVLKLQAQPCQTRGCMFFGNAHTNFYCSKCCQLQSHHQKKILTDV